MEPIAKFMTFAVFIAWAWFLYKLHDYLYYKRNFKYSVGFCIGLFFISLLAMDWLMNGSLPWGGYGEPCYGSGITSTC